MTSVDLGLWAYAIITILTFVSLFRVTAPYGRHQRSGWGPKISDTLGWVGMEGVALLLMPGMVLAKVGVAGLIADPALLVLWLMWVLHYTHRTIIYPLRRHTPGKQMPLVIALMAVAFNSLNGWLNGAMLADAAPRLDPTAPIFIAGVATWLVGQLINIAADEHILRLRRTGGPGYHLPTAGLHAHVAAPNYLGEIIAWCGFAMAAGTPAAWLFAAYTVANLAPRARSHLAWYRTRFADYPAHRKALIPFIW